MKVRILKRNCRGITVAMFEVVYAAAKTKKEARRLARADFPLPTFTLGRAWKLSA